MATEKAKSKDEKVVLGVTHLIDKKIDISWVKHRAKMFREAFEKEAINFEWIMRNGSGIDNIHMLNCIRSLHCLYLENAAHEELIRSAEGKI